MKKELLYITFKIYKSSIVAWLSNWNNLRVRSLIGLARQNYILSWSFLPAVHKEGFLTYEKYNKSHTSFFNFIFLPLLLLYLIIAGDIALLFAYGDLSIYTIFLIFTWQVIIFVFGFAYNIKIYTMLWCYIWGFQRPQFIEQYDLMAAARVYEAVTRNTDDDFDQNKTKKAREMFKATVSYHSGQDLADLEEPQWELVFYTFNAHPSCNIRTLRFKNSK